MKKILEHIIYNVLYGLWYAVSSMPLWIHYIFSTMLSALLYHVLRYRRKVVHRNLTESFPTYSKSQIWRIERSFYLHFCDIIVESIKYFSISRKQMMKRMQFKGLDLIEESCRNGHSCGVFLGHYGNWEWVSSLQLWIDPSVGKCVQLYHPLENKAFDRLMGYIRERMGSTNIPVEQSLRHIVKYRNEGIPLVIGFIADQVPLWNNIHYWTDFLNHKTCCFTGAERIIRMMDMDVYYMHIERVSRGHYVAEFRRLMQGSKDAPDNKITELYTRALEDNIKEAPAYWLWSHRRWKRTYEEWQEWLKLHTNSIK